MVIYGTGRAQMQMKPSSGDHPGTESGGHCDDAQPDHVAGGNPAPTFREVGVGEGDDAAGQAPGRCDKPN